MLLDNKYSRWYFEIVLSAQFRGFGDEKHHIIPKSIGGSNKSTNLVTLTFREHFLCHWILTKCVTPEYKKKMYFALHCLRRENPYQTRILTSWQFEIARKATKSVMVGNKIGVNNRAPKSPETRRKMSEAACNRSPEYKLKHKLGIEKRILTPEHRQKMRDHCYRLNATRRKGG